MSELDIRWRVKKMDDGTARFEVMADGVKIGEQSFVRLVETVIQGTSSLRYHDPKLR